MLTIELRDDQVLGSVLVRLFSAMSRVTNSDSVLQLMGSGPEILLDERSKVTSAVSSDQAPGSAPCIHTRKKRDLLVWAGRMAQYEWLESHAHNTHKQSK